MSYYRPSFSQTIAMTRGRGGYSPRGSSYRGSSRGSRGGYGGPRGFSFDSRSKYSSDRYSGSRSSKFEDYRKPFRSESYSSRDRSPDRKKQRIEGYSSRHDSSYGSSGSYGGRYESSFSERRSFSGDRSMSYPRREEFRRPSGPPMSSRGGYRGRGSSRGSRILRGRDRMPPRRRMIESSYGIRKRMISSRALDYTRKLKISKLRSAIAARRTNKSDEDDSDAEKEDKKDSDKEEDDTEVKEKKTSKKDKDESEQADKAPSDEGRPKKAMIKLLCPHCNVRCITFRKYEIHLGSRMHMLAMKRVALKQKAILSQMRQAQRSAQNEMEKSGDDLNSRTLFCPLCKLNYKQQKSVHQESDSHKNMKKFLMPFCKVCSVTFKSPMIYESHCCSIEHLKRKQRMESEASDSNEEADLENFTTIDSVGDVDDEETVKKEPSEPKETVNVGFEKIRKVEAHYCDLCKMYLPRSSEADFPKVLAKHCKLFVHMKRYVQYKEDTDLEERAQKLQKKETAEKEEKAKKVKVENKEDESPKKESTSDSKDEVEEAEGLNKSVDEEENKDDKMWADVDKDLGDILADAEDDDEEDSSAKTKERYDRFKLSEKNGEESLKEKDEEKISNGQAEDVKEES